MSRICVAACQINTRVGDLAGNVARIRVMLGEAEAAGAGLAVFPELAVCGYPPEDLLLKPAFVEANREALDELATATGGCAAVVGFVDRGRDLYNAAAVLADGHVQGIYRKCELPNYGVFDEMRYFARGDEPAQLYRIGGVAVGVSVCEDAWNPNGPVADQADSGAELIVNLNASPYAEGKQAQRERLFSTRAADASCALVSVNQVGAQDELVFDGASIAFDALGELVARAPQFDEALLCVDLDIEPVYRKRLLDPRGRPSDCQLPLVELATVTEVTGGDAVTEVTGGDASTGARAAAITPLLQPDEEVYRALVVGTRDYVDKNGFAEVVIGLSGGIDSTLVAVIAVDALGADRVHGVSMPSRYSSQGSRSDADKLASNLGIDHRSIAIEPAHAAVTEMLAPSFAGLEEGLTEENLQSRIRGQVLMALSNKFGWLVLTTGNKSEMAVGYATLYGDTCGGFGVLKDVLKTRVYALCRARNRWAGHELIPESVITKPPSAELRPDQRDDESLPGYDTLDAVLAAYVEQDRTAAEIIADGHDADLVNQICRLVDGAEYKRRQSPPGPRVTTKAFGKDRRLPITNRFGR